MMNTKGGREEMRADKKAREIAEIRKILEVLPGFEPGDEWFYYCRKKEEKRATVATVISVVAILAAVIAIILKLEK